MKGNYVRMPELLEDLNFAIEILFQLLVQSCEFDRFDSNCGARDLFSHSLVQLKRPSKQTNIPNQAEPTGCVPSGA